MRINDEVYEDVTLRKYVSDPVIRRIVTSAAISAYLKDIQKPFSPSDKSTWPKADQRLLTLNKQHRISEHRFWTVKDAGHPNWTDNVIAYIDPSDILPENG